MGKIIVRIIICILVPSLLISSTTIIKNSDFVVYPKELKVSSEIIHKLNNQNPDYIETIDIDKLKLFSLGNYYIFQSGLPGPTGRGSNYFYYLLVDDLFSKEFFFISLSGEMKNIWLSEDTLFVDLLDYYDEAYYNGEYYECDPCDYSIIHTKQSTTSFSLDTISEESVSLTWSDLIYYSAN